MSTLLIHVVDAQHNPIERAQVSLRQGEGTHDVRWEGRFWLAQNLRGQSALLRVAADAYGSVEQRVRLRDSVDQLVIALPRGDAEFSYSIGNSRYVATRQHTSLLRFGDDSYARLREMLLAEPTRWIELSEFAKSVRTKVRPVLVRVETSIERVPGLINELREAGIAATPLLPLTQDPAAPFGLGTDAVIHFTANVRAEQAARIAERHGCRLLQSLPYLQNGYLSKWTADRDLPSYQLLAALDRMQQDGDVVYAQPNVVFDTTLDEHIPDDPLWPDVSYLRKINVHKAWGRLEKRHPNLRGGSPAIAIAIADPQGVDPSHGEFRGVLTDSRTKLIGSWNFAASPPKEQTIASLKGDHGTACAGTATARFDDQHGLPGVAPNCRLIGVQLPDVMDEVQLADAYYWIAGFREGMSAAPPSEAAFQPADVISTSWGKERMGLGDVLRDCFEFLTTFGRAGRGCVLCFSIGNNGFRDFTVMSPSTWYRAWPSYERVLAVGASIGAKPTNPVALSEHPTPDNKTSNIAVSTDRRALYNPYGNEYLRKPDLVAPSSTALIGQSAAVEHIDPLLSAVRTGQGDVDGGTAQAPAKDYARRAGGTSHSTPVVAGVVALMLSARPDLSWVQVREALRRTSRIIDRRQSHPSGKWLDLDADGSVDFNRWYGAGCVNADKALQRVLAARTAWPDIHVRDHLLDDGALTETGAPRPDCPDIWVRSDANAPPPTVPWGQEPPHQVPKPGVDNTLYCRARNRGTGVAPVTYLRALVAEGSPLDVRYPCDYRQTPEDDSARGVRFIGSQDITNLEPGADEVVSFTWRPTDRRVQVSNSPPVVAHRTVCLLLEASPHDGPHAPDGLRVSNNIAFRHIHHLVPGQAGTDEFLLVDAGAPEGVTHLVIDAKGLLGPAVIHMQIREISIMTAFEQAMAAQVPVGAAVSSGIHRSLNCINVSLNAHAGMVELPLDLAPGQEAGVLLAISTPAQGSLHVTQRCVGGSLSAGLRVHLQAAS